MSVYAVEQDRCPSMRPRRGGWWAGQLPSTRCVRDVHASGRHRDEKGNRWQDPWDESLADEEDVLDALLPPPKRPR